MSKVETMSMQGIIARIGIPNMGKRAYCVFKNFQLAEEFLRIIQEEQSKKLAEKFLISHESEIDKEKFILVAAIEEDEKIESQGLTTIPENKRRIMNLGKGINTFLTTCEYSEESGYTIIVSPAKNFLRKKQIPDNRNQERVTHLKRELQQKRINLETVFSLMLPTDLMEILPEGKKSLDVLKHTNREDYIRFIKASRLTVTPKLIENYIEFINWDKLLLLLAYRCKEYLEQETSTNKRLTDFFKIIFQKIYQALKDNRYSQLSCELQRNGTDQFLPVSFDVKDLQQCIKQITSEGYITDREVEQSRQQVMSSKTTLLQMPAERVRACFSQEQLLKIVQYSEENLRYVLRSIEENPEKTYSVLKKCNRCSKELVDELLEAGRITIENVVALYSEQKVEINTIRYLREKGYDFSDQIDFYHLEKLYLQWEKDTANQESKRAYLRCLEFYKVAKLEGQNQEVIDEHDRSIQNYIDSCVPRRKHNHALTRYYTDGLITIRVIAKKLGQEKIIDLCNQGKVPRKDLQILVEEQCIPTDFLNDYYMQRILNGAIQEREEIVKLLSMGIISKTNVDKLLVEGLIGINDLDFLLQEGRITPEEKEEIESNFDFRKALALKGYEDVAISMEKFHNEVSETRNFSGSPKQKKAKIIIDPEKRQEFFAALGLSQVTFGKMSPQNPFYHYHFYGRIDENGHLVANSPVIAERFYENKDTQSSYATGNGTYIFRREDFPVIDTYAKKQEIINARNGEIYRSTHVLASEKGKGHWATSVINNFMRIVIGPELEEYDEKKQALKIIDKMKEMYSFPSLKRIYTYEWEIDQGEHLLIEEEEKKKSPSDDTEGYSL